VLTGCGVLYVAMPRSPLAESERSRVLLVLTFIAAAIAP
jgi:hypothetical protein